MNAFLARSAFPGPAIGVESAGAAGVFAGEASFSGCIAFVNWPRDDVARLLPPEIVLATNISATPSLHPVAIVFGEQSETAVLFASRALPTGLRYGEFAMIVPFVTHRGSRYLHAYVPRMYSSYFPVVWDGNVRFGFSKELGNMSWQGHMFVVTSEKETLLFHAAVEATQDWCQGGCASPHFADMREIFSLPMLGRRTDGTYVQSYFGWDFAKAVVRPVDAWLSIDAPLCRGLTARRSDVPSATFAVRQMRWRLSWPSLCRF